MLEFASAALAPRCFIPSWLPDAHWGTWGRVSGPCTFTELVSERPGDRAWTREWKEQAGLNSTQLRKQWTLGGSAKQLVLGEGISKEESMLFWFLKSHFIVVLKKRLEKEPSIPKGEDPKWSLRVWEWIRVHGVRGIGREDVWDGRCSGPFQIIVSPVWPKTSPHRPSSSSRRARFLISAPTPPDPDSKSEMRWLWRKHWRRNSQRDTQDKPAPWEPWSSVSVANMSILVTDNWRI